MQFETLPSKLNRRQWLVATTGLATTSSAFVSAAGDEPTHSSGSAHAINFAEGKTTRWQIGMKLSTPVTITSGMATFPIPMDWPEQTVSITNRSVDPRVGNVQTRDLQNGVRQVVVNIPRVLGGSSLDVLFDFEIERRKIVAPVTTDGLVLPKRGDRELRPFFGNSPMIDASHIRIRALSKELAASAPKDAWGIVKHIYDQVRERVAYAEGPIRNASDALKDGKGDCEDMTSLFVALCRNAGVPARMVWIPGHCYPEFYLESVSTQGGSPGRTRERTGHWFPCQAAGTEQFGGMDEDRPVLQKGDRFKVPEQRAPSRYVSEFFRCDRVGAKSPRVKFVRELLA